MKTETLELTAQPEGESTNQIALQPIAILEKAIQGGVTTENVAVVKELIQMCREQRAEDAKTAFAKAFFQLRKNMPEIYADKEGKNDSGAVCFRYCSEEEISKKLEPHLMAYGFAMLFGQSADEARITVNITLMHEAGHSETREFAVRAGATNRMKDGAMADSGAATTAWRHLVMKLFGLKSRITATNEDARLVGEKLTPDKIQYLREQIKECGGTEASYLELAGAKSFEEIGTNVYPVLIRATEARKRKVGR